MTETWRRGRAFIAFHLFGTTNPFVGHNTRQVLLVIEVLMGCQLDRWSALKLVRELSESLDMDYLMSAFCIYVLTLFFFLLLCTLFGRQRLLFMNSSRRLLTFQLSFISSVGPWTVHVTYKLHFSVTFSLKMGPTVLFTYLKIILL